MYSALGAQTTPDGLLREKRMILVSTNVPEAMPSLKASRKGSVAAIRSQIWVTHRPAFYNAPVNVRWLNDRSLISLSRLGAESIVARVSSIPRPYIRSGGRP